LNFIKNHIPRRAEICEPITRLTKKDVRFVWGEEQQRAFDKLKAVVLETILLTYPNPNRPFDIYPNASSTYAMGAVLAQGGKIISTFSRKFNDAQLKYIVTGQELLAAVEACKHFKQIIRGCEIRIHTDHQNLTHDGMVHVNLRQQRAQILLDSEFGATFIHIKGTDNTAADSLSRLEISDDEPTEIANKIFAILQNNLDREESNDFPLDMKRIMTAQRSDDEIQRRINSGKLSAKIGTKTIDGGEVTTINGLVWVPKEAQQQIVEWYHSNLQHAGITRKINSISQMFTWKGLRPMVEQHVLSCDSCQRNKSTNKKSYGKSHSPQLFVIKILGRSFTSIAVALGRSGGTMRRRERLGLLKSTFYQWWRRAPDGANLPESNQHRQLQRQLNSARGGYAVTHNPTRSYMITVLNSWVASSRRCWTATASKANPPQSKIRRPTR
jgi:hypothetical protein